MIPVHKMALTLIPPVIPVWDWRRTNGFLSRETWTTLFFMNRIPWMVFPSDTENRAVGKYR